MTTWLEFRSEPMSDVPEIEIRRLDSEFEVECLASVCSFQEQATNRGEAVEIQMGHIQWHEEGMPQ